MALSMNTYILLISTTFEQQIKLEYYIIDIIDIIASFSNSLKSWYNNIYHFIVI
jgi:hypothetical protein